MEDKNKEIQMLLKVLQEKQENLENQQEEVNNQLDKITTTYKYNAQALQESKEYKGYQQDLEKISKELQETKEEYTIVQEYNDSKSNLENEKVQLSSRKQKLYEEKKQSEEALKKIQGKYILKEGNYEKTVEETEIENDLFNINKEISVVEEELGKGSQQIDKYNDYINQKMQKYHIAEKVEQAAREEAEKEEAERKAREQAEKEEAERKAREQAEKEEAEKKAKEQAEQKEPETKVSPTDEVQPESKETPVAKTESKGKVALKTPEVNNEKKAIQTNNISNDSIRILYSAKQDKYLIKNVNTEEEWHVNRKDLRFDKERLAEKAGKTLEDLKNVDINVLEVLRMYDRQFGTNKANEYYKMMTEIGKSPKDRENEMEESQIDIEYNLKGLFDKNKKSKQPKIDVTDRTELLSIANNAKKKGIATVKKGFKVSAFEMRDNILRKIKAIPLPGSKKVERLSDG